jgi:hypothetical protein
MYLSKLEGSRADYHSPEQTGVMSYDPDIAAEAYGDSRKLDVSGKANESAAAWNSGMEQRPYESALAAEWFLPPTPNGSECPLCFDFESITVGDLESALDTIYFAGRISLDDMAAIADRYEQVFPGLTCEQRDAMPAGISYEALQADIASSHANGNCEERDRLLRILQLLWKFDAGSKKLDVAA